MIQIADFDVQNDVTPKNTLVVATAPTVGAMKTALTAYNSVSYSSDRLLAMTDNDLIYACNLHGLSVVGLP